MSCDAMMLKNEARKYPDKPVLAVGAVVFKDDKVLLVKRGKAPARNMWAIPGGKVELGETLKEAAQRELLEETGIRIKAGNPVYSFEVIKRDPAGKILFHYFIVDLEAQYLSGDITAADDAKDAAWISEEDLNKINVNPNTRELLKQKYNFGVY